MLSKIMNKMAAFVAILALTFGVTFGAASPASAAFADCWNNTVCLFAHGGFVNPIWRQVDGEIPNCRSLVGTGWNNVTSSAVNQYDNGVVFVLWDSSNCSGDYYSVAVDTNVNFAGTNWNDRVSAVSVILL